MGATTVRSKQIRDGSVGQDDLDITTSGQAVVAKLAQGTGITLSSTGVDSGTGVVTVGLNAPVPIASGGTGQTAQQPAINALANVSSATNGHVLVKDPISGNAMFRALGGVSVLTSTVTVQNTASETQLIGINIDPDSLNVGTTFKISAYGVATISSDVPLIKWRCRVGANTLAGNIIAEVDLRPVSGLADRPWHTVFLITTRTIGGAGAIIGSGFCYSEIDDPTLANPNFIKGSNITSTAQINTTLGNILELTFQFDEANVNNILACTVGMVEIIKL